MINLRELEDELESLYTTAFNESHEAAKERDLEHTARQCGPDVTDHGWDLLEEAGRGDIEATEIETEAASDLMTEVRDCLYQNAVLLADRDVQKLLEAGFNVGSQTASQKASGLIDDAAEKGMIYAYLNTPQPYNRKKVKRTQGEVQGFKEELINQLFRDDNAYKKLSKLFPEGSEWVEFFDLASHSAGDPDHADYYPYQWHGRAEDLVNKIWDEQNGSRLKRDYLSCRMQIEMDGVKYEFEMEKSYSAVLSALIIRNEEDDYWGHSEVEEFDSFVGSIKDRKNHFITVSREGEHAGSVWLTENDGELHYYDEMPNKEGRNEMGPVREKLRKFADLVATRLGYAAAKYDPDGLVELRMNERMK